MIKAVLFDCYGVLVGSGFWQVYQRLGGDIDSDEAFITDWLDKMNSGRVSVQIFNTVMADKLGVDLGEYKAAFLSDEVPDEQLFSYITLELKGRYKLAIVSNASAGSVQRKIPAEKLALFDEVVVSGDVGLLKPDPKFFEQVLTKLDVQPEEAVFADDHQAYVDGAAACGLNAVLYRNPQEFMQQFEQLKNAV